MGSQTSQLWPVQPRLSSSNANSATRDGEHTKWTQAGGGEPVLDGKEAAIWRGVMRRRGVKYLRGMRKVSDERQRSGPEEA